MYLKQFQIRIGDYRLNLIGLPQPTNGKNLGSPLMTLLILSMNHTEIAPGKRHFTARGIKKKKDC